MGFLTKFLVGTPHEHMANDVLVEAAAEKLFDSREVLPRIAVPVLLLGGTEDDYFPESLMRETADLIPDCTLRLYEGKSHLSAGMDPRVPEDILEFVGATIEWE